MGEWWPPTRSWASGPWSLLVRDGELAEIAARGQVLLRGIRAIVRLADWVTVPWSVTAVETAETSVTVHLAAAEPQIAGTLRARVDGDRLEATVDLEPAEELWTNRAGLIVLHPPALAGTPLTVRHTDGGHSPAEFPQAPAPHQPARDIAGLTWEQGGLRVELGLEGDVFEMEDQRNWTDASFKTYNRPLALPFPYRVGAGERIRHRLALSAARTTAEVTAAPAVAPGRRVSPQEAGGHGPHVIDLTPAGPLPQIGLGAATAPDPAPDVAGSRMGGQAGMPDEAPLLVELDLRTASWPAAWERAAASGHPLDVRLVLDPADDLGDAGDAEKVRSAVAGLVGHPVLRVGAFSGGPPARHVSDTATIALLREALDAAALDLPVVGGARSHFTELNRGLDWLPADLDGLAVAMSPLFHDLGTPQLVESVAIQRILARRAVQMAGEVAAGPVGGPRVHIGPVTLRPPFNAVAERDDAPTRADLTEGYGPALADATDARQRAPELAAWTIASAAALAVPGVASITYFEQWGPRGVVAADGTPYPVAAALEALLRLTAPGGPAVHLLHGDSPDGLLWAVGSTDRTRTRLLLANLHPAAQQVQLNTPAGTLTERVEAASWMEQTLQHP